MIIGAAEFTRRGCDLFSVKDQLVDDDNDDDNDVWPSLCQDPHFEQYMPLSRWKDLRRFFAEIFVDEGKKETVPWYRFLRRSMNLTVFVKVKFYAQNGSQWMRP
jgi:hypothetical protein